MTTFSAFLIALAGVVAAGCAAPGSRIYPQTHTPLWRDTGTPPVTIAQEREVRYYHDERGAVWDDRGRKVGAGS